jgi:ubiquinone/menaquinone biosynthesis C-methylase UbiE
MAVVTPRHEDDPLKRFTARVDDYIRYRPHYPAELVRWLHDAIDFRKWWIVADIGCGTGMLADRFLDNGNLVYGVEPNAAMRAAAEEIYLRQPRFCSIDGSAEATTLPDGSTDLITAGQAFHWFEPDATRREWKRVLSPGGRALVVFNSRRTDATPFMAAYDAFLAAQAVDYTGVEHRRVLGAQLKKFLGDYLEWHHRFTRQRTWDEVRGLAMSSSYSPAPDHSTHTAFYEALKRLFDEHAVDGHVEFLYECEAYTGWLD